MHDEFFAMLSKDHELLKGILQQLKLATGEEAKKREELYARFKLIILPHTGAEDIVFYARLKDDKEAYGDVLESMEEHHVIEMVMNELDQAPKQTDQWWAKLRVCKELVEHHIKEEEDQIFGEARNALSAGEMRSIFDRFQAERERIRNSMQ